MNKGNNGIDTNTIVLDSGGRFQLNEEQLAAIAGGRRKKTIIIIRGTHCKPAGPAGPVIRGTRCTNS